MVTLVRRGAALRAVARRLAVSLDTVQRWVARAAGQRLDRVDWTDHPSIAATIHRTDDDTEALVLTLRTDLRDRSALGEFGAAAIQRALRAQSPGYIPTVRTIGRILERRGALDYRRRVRRPAPPPGWYLPDVADGRAELDSFDIVEGLRLPDETDVDVLTGTSLHGGLIGAWPARSWNAQQVVATLIAHWRQWGVAAYAQFDNDNRFQGPHQHADVVGRVMRLCLSLGTTPVFAPPREPGFQNAVENLNGRWQAKVWARFASGSLEELAAHSDRYVVASRERAAARAEHAPPRRGFPRHWALDLQAPLRGRIIFLRRTSERGAVSLLGHTIPVDPLWCHRLVRCEVLLSDRRACFYGLRRAQPDAQPLLREIPYILPTRRFKE
jgi:hypothetical protein